MSTKLKADFIGTEEMFIHGQLVTVKKYGMPYVEVDGVDLKTLLDELVDDSEWQGEAGTDTDKEEGEDE